MKKSLLQLYLPAAAAVIVFIALFNISIVFKIYKNTAFLKTTQVSLETTNKSSLDILAETIVKRLSDRQKIGQLLMVNYYGDELSKVETLIKDYSITGLMIKSDNVQKLSFEELRSQNAAILSYSREIPFLISVDQEGGSVSRLDNILKNFPSPAELYRTRGKEGVLESAEYTSRKLRELNIAVNFSPVLDLVQNPKSIVADRSFSTDPDVNLELGRTFLDVYTKNSAIAVLKHFPGYGNVAQDPHEDRCVDDKSRIEDIARPFLKLSASPMIMTSHVIYSLYDQRPGTYSPKVIQILRGYYSNVIITDDIQMKAITKNLDYREASLEALKAGCDIILSITQEKDQWYNKAVALFDFVYQAYEKGGLDKSRIDEAVLRVVKLKLRFCPSEQWGILSEKEKRLYEARL